MLDNCLKCGAPVALTLLECPVCRTHAGFPNVKAAGTAKETSSLAARYESAAASAKARGVTAELKAFEAAVTSSKAVMNRSLGALSSWINGDNALFLSFHNQVNHMGRTPTESEWDQGRSSAEATINPYYYQELNYAALTLDGIGMTYYGPYAVTLKSLTIEARASVFEQNPFIFCKTHHVVAGQPPPSGHRATWECRGRLGAAKLQASITPGSSAFADILMEPRRNASDCDFIEVHIYGPINRLGIERIVGPCPTLRADRATWKQAVRQAREFGALVEETT